ncbi:hypothetical protein OKW50_000689 [Paraburkholderia youngii]|uniref:hypothetical protein n=1 Tax=Paraburkholderia youngii TaxID=2782701 RepID=UPI003D19F0F3
MNAPTDFIPLPMRHWVLDLAFDEWVRLGGSGEAVAGFSHDDCTGGSVVWVWGKDADPLLWKVTGDMKLGDRVAWPRSQGDSHE